MLPHTSTNDLYKETRRPPLHSLTSSEINIIDGPTTSAFSAADRNFYKHVNVLHYPKNLLAEFNSSSKEVALQEVNDDLITTPLTYGIVPQHLQTNPRKSPESHLIAKNSQPTEFNGLHDVNIHVSDPRLIKQNKEGHKGLQIISFTNNSAHQNEPSERPDSSQQMSQLYDSDDEINSEISVFSSTYHDFGDPKYKCYHGKAEMWVDERSLIPTEGNKPQFAQLYIYDRENEIQNRVHCMRSQAHKLKSDVIQSLKHTIDHHNVYAQNFCIARDHFPINQDEQIRIRLIRKRASGGRMYNLPTASEVAALIVGDESLQPDGKDIIVETQS